MEKVKISDGEWKILQVLWKNPHINLKTIVEKLEDNNWSYSTVKTMLQRLVDKGIVGVDKSLKKTYYYFAMIEEECKIQETENFLDRVFEGSLSLFATTLVKSEKISMKKKEALLKMVEEMEE